ncbi:MAG: TolC family protein [Phycisphaerales bacterium]|nr:TolC family protein [Phycisphaerales bacterium]
MPNWSCSRSWWFAIVLIGLVHVGCASRDRGVADMEQRILEELRRDGIPGPHNDSTSSAHEAPSAHSALPDAGPISLADLLALAEARNPALAAARSEVGIAAGQVWQAHLYPNPRLEVASDEVPFDSGFDNGITTVSMTQPIVLGDRLSAATDAAEAEKAASRAKLELRAREIFGEIAQLHARLLAIRQAQTLYDELAELGGRTLSMARTRFEARAAPETEVIRPQIELHQIDLARARLIKENDAALRQLELLLGGVEIDADRLAGEVTDNPPAIDLDAVATQVRQGHPALAMADREIAAAQARLERIGAERVPDLEVRAGAGYQGEIDEGIFEVGAGVTLPLWDNRQGDILAARFDLMRARHLREATQNDLLGRLAEVHGEYESARAQLATVRDQIVPAALRSFEQTQEAYRGGRAVFLELLDAQRTVTEARATLIELGGAAAAARARMMQIVGSDLEQATETSTFESIQTQPLSGSEVVP